MPDKLIRLINLIIPISILILASLSILHSIVPGLASYQLIFIAVGILGAFVISRFDIELFSSSSLVWFALGVIPLILTEIFGIVNRGSSRWIVIFGNQFQTSEFSKLALIMFAAIWLSNHDLSKLKELIKFILLMTIPVLLVFIQPDLGSAIMLAAIAVIGLIAAGTPMKQLLFLLLLGSVIIPILSLGLKSYQLDRITSFINPYKDQFGSGYNSIQATIAVGSGQIIGRGLGQGTQSHLKFLPERHTDFVFASFVEELGLIGGLILIGAYLWLTYNLISTSKIASSSIQSLICLISAGLFLSQSMVNIGMNMGILPITGVTLPLVSYGGSSILSTLFILGLNWSIIIRSRPQTKVIEIR